MGDIMKVISGMGVLIAIFLFISNSGSTSQVISSIGSTVTNVTRTLQGRG